MRKALRIAWREYVATVCTKGFILGLVLTPLMMAGGLIGVAVMQRQGDEAEWKIAILDHTGRFGEPLLSAAERRRQSEEKSPGRGPVFLLELAAVRNDTIEEVRLTLSDQVRSGRLHSFLEIDDSVLPGVPDSTQSPLLYYAQNPALDEGRQWLAAEINDLLRRARLAAAGINPDAITNLFAWVPVHGMGLVERDLDSGAIRAAQRQNEAVALGVPAGVTLLAMVLILTGASPLLQSVMEEKTQRIAEVMLGVATPWDLMMGKLLGGVAVSLTAMGVYLIGIFATLTSLAAADAVAWSLIPWLIVFVVGGILMFGAAAIALGSACGDPKDAQHLQLPLILPMLIPVFLLMPVIKHPQGGLATGLAFFPPFTPLLMLLRMSAPGGVPMWQPWVGLASVLLCTTLVLWIGTRIFRVGILTQGRLPTLTELLRWGWRG
jgi:ABC-2 type transport system permease protein